MMREPTRVHDIYAAPTPEERWKRKAHLHWLAAYRLLPCFVVTRTMAGVPSAVKSVDAFLSELVGTTTDAAGVQPSQMRQMGRVASKYPGEMAMARDFVEMALQMADLPFDCEDRRDARAWLLDRFPLYSARTCFECIGIDMGMTVDFDVVKAKLTERWMRQKASESPEEGHA